jgi:RecB family exonuclease
VLHQVAPEGIVFRSAEEHNAEESFLFTAALGAARVEAVLSYPRLDGRGQENPPSRFFGYLNEPVSEARAVQPASRVIGASRAPMPRIENPAVLDMLNDKLTRVSPSGLESFLKCPLQFFFGKTLRLQDLPDLPGDRMNFLAQGSIAHQALARWIKNSEPIASLLDEEFDRYCVQHKIPPGYALEVTRVNMRKAIESFTREFRAHSGHLAETEQELVMVLDEHTSISGRADLIVHEDAGDVIYDYKYSKVQGTRDRVSDSSTMQAPIYVHAVATNTGRFPAGMLYVDLKAGEQFGMAGWHTSLSGKFILPLTPEWVSKRMDAVRSSVAGIRSGTIAPSPNSAQTCKRCDFRHACRYAAAEAALTAGDSE